MATVTRGLQGFSCGQIIVLKALMGEACTKKMLSYGLACMMSGWAVGNTLGPSIGGWTAFPAEEFPHVFSHDGVFSEFPALLPNLIIAAGLGVGIILTLIFFPKNLMKRSKEEEAVLNERKPNGYGATESNGHVAKATNGYGVKETTGYFVSETTKQTTPTLVERFMSSGFVRVLCSKECSICSLLYLLLSIAGTLSIAKGCIYSSLYK